MTIVLGKESPSTAIAVPGIEARHAWNGEVVLGDLSGWPRVKLGGIDGLHDTADADDLREPAQGRMGEIPLTSFLRGKTLTYEGRIQAKSLADLRAMGTAMRSAFSSTAEGQMIITHHPAYGGPTFTFTGRCIQYKQYDAQVTGSGHYTYGYERPFIAAIRMSDSRFYMPGEQAVTTGALSDFAGITPPITPPIFLEDVGVGGSVVATNIGTAPTDPIIDTYGPVTNPRIRNDTLNKELRFEGMELSEGQYMRVDFGNRTVMLDGTSDYRSKLDMDDSDWWDEDVDGLAAGANSIRYRGDIIADPAYARIRFFHAVY